MPRPARLPRARLHPRKAPHALRTRTPPPGAGKGHRSRYGGQGQAQPLQRRSRVGRLLQCARGRCPRLGLGTGRESPSMRAKAHVQEPAPAPYVGEMKNAAQFWCDRVIKQYKETSVDSNVDGWIWADACCRNAAAVAWAKSFIALVAALESYVKQWHTTGVVWNPKVSPAYCARR